MTTLIPDLLHLLLACREDDSDALRLVLADLLDDQPSPWVQCKACDGTGRFRGYDRLVKSGHCDDCGGSGQVQDRDLALRSELIRVQVGLSRFGPNDSNVAGYMLAKRHESQLLRDHGQRWLSLRCPVYVGVNRSQHQDCHTCDGTGDLFKRRLRYERDTLDGAEIVTENASVATFDRGLVVVTAPPERLWMTCKRCDGDGQDHGADRPFEGPPGKRPVCKGSGLIPCPWLRAVAANPWVCGLRVEVIRPVTSSTYSGFWVWSLGWGAMSRLTLPKQIWHLCSGDYHTEAAAEHALSRALLRWALEGEAK